LWDRVEVIGEQFWEALAWTSDGRHLWRTIEGLAPTILTAAPNQSKSLFADSEAGKRRWIRREIGPEHEARAIVCRRHDKPSFAAAGHILIDDFKPTIRDWRAAGGTGILHVCASRTIDELKRLIQLGQLPEARTDRRTA
jgi:hypothetical protein